MEDFTIKKETVENLKNKGKTIGDIAVGAAMKQIADPATISLGLGVGLIQGLKRNGSFKRGVKAGLTTVGVFAGANIIMNVADKWDVIKR